MSIDHLNFAEAAIKSTLAARRRTVENLTVANNSHNRAELLQIVETLKALREIQKQEAASQ